MGSVQGEPVPEWVVEGKRRLLRRHSTFWVLSAGVGGAAFAAYRLRCEGLFSRTGLAALMWPAFVIPLVGWLGYFSLPLVWIAAVFPIIVIRRAFQRRIRWADLLSVPFYVVVLIRVHKFVGDWWKLGD